MPNDPERRDGDADRDQVELDETWTPHDVVDALGERRRVGAVVRAEVIGMIDG